MRITLWPLLCLSLTAPALATEPHPPEPPRRPATPRPAVPAPGCPLDPTSAYRGTYFCAQGWTDLTFRVLSLNGAALRAEFVFRHDPSHVAGRFTLTGTCAPDGTVSLTPEAWVDRPPGYVMVGMLGTASTDGVFAGRMQMEGCGSFSVRRP